MNTRPFSDQFDDGGLDRLAEEEMKRCHDRGFHRPEHVVLWLANESGPEVRIWRCRDCRESLYGVPE